MNIEEQNEKRRQLQEIVRQYFVKNPEHFWEGKRELAYYTLQNKLEKGILSLNDLDWLVTNNLARAEKLGFSLSWRFGKDAIYAQIHEGNVKLSDIQYSNGYTHRRIAEMQFDFDSTLTQLEKFSNELQGGI